MKFTKTQRGWAMYDWANSVYSLVISTVLFPIYYEEVTKNETNSVLFLGREGKHCHLQLCHSGFFFNHIHSLSVFRGHGGLNWAQKGVHADVYDYWGH